MANRTPAVQMQISGVIGCARLLFGLGVIASAVVRAAGTLLGRRKRRTIDLDG